MQDLALDQGQFLADLAVVLGTAAVTSVIFTRLRLPLILGYLVSGLIIGPHVPVPLVAEPATAITLSELGVILLMFSVGLEFSARRIVDLGSSASVIALLEVGAVVWMGYVCGGAFGWGPRESVFLGIGLSVASTMIIGKSLLERRPRSDARANDLLLGIVVAEDLVSVFLLAIVTAVAAGVGLSAREFALTSAQLLFFLGLLVAGGALLVPRILRMIPRRRSGEVLLLVGVGLCFAMALLAKRFGYSVALGAFVTGSLTAASGRGRELQPLVRPLTLVFSAVFFVSVGMAIDPRLVVANWKPALVLIAVFPLVKAAATGLAGLLVGRGLQLSLSTGMRLVPTGEFSFIVAAAAGSFGERRGDLYAVFAAVCVGTVLMQPLAERYAGAAAARVARRMPQPLVTFETLLATWYDKLRLHRESGIGWPGLLRATAWIAVDAALILAFVIGTSSSLPRLSTFLDELLPGPLVVARWLIVSVAVLACAPFATGIVMQTHRLAELAAESVFPTPGTRVDPAAAPRRALRVTMHAVLLGAVGLPVLALLQPFLPYSTGAAGLLLALIVGGSLVWRSIANLEGHVRAGTQVVADVLARQARAHQPHDLEQVNRLLPGLGNLTPLRLRHDSCAVGRRLGDLDVHGRTQATIVCLSRGDDGVLAPDDDLTLSSGDVIVLAGTLEAIELALVLLASSAEPGRDRERGTT